MIVIYEDVDRDIIIPTSRFDRIYKLDNRYTNDKHYYIIGEVGYAKYYLCITKYEDERDIMYDKFITEPHIKYISIMKEGGRRILISYK